MHTHTFLRTQAHMPGTDTGMGKKYLDTNIRCKNHFNYLHLSIASKHKGGNGTKANQTERTFQNPNNNKTLVGSGVSAKCEMLRLAQKGKSPWCRDRISAAAGCRKASVPAHFGTATLLFSHFLRMPKLYEQLLG